MGYRDDPFFNVNWTGDGLETRASSGGIENSPYLFPDKGIRFLQAQAELDKKFNKAFSTIAGGDYTLHRGYVRNLEQPAFGEIPINKCNFQFNPQEIRQSVNMREDMYLPLLQDVKQLAQPVGAVANFTFDLMFDRSHEVSKGKVGYGTGSPDAGRDPEADMYNFGSSDQYDIGVLADLRVLYSVIGQGFSKEMLDFQKRKFTTYQSNKNKNNTTETTTTTDADGNETTVTTTNADDQLTEAEIESLLQANYGNWGLLMPNPIRVMFSSLFMLDGFITGTNVDFLKFNTKMVPLMCRVTMNMSAMYIGFAREKTFLTDILYESGKEVERQNEEKAAQLAELVTALSRTGSSFVVSTALNSNDNESNWDDAANNVHQDKLNVWALGVADSAAVDSNGIDDGSDRALFLGFPQIKPRAGDGADVDHILRIFEQGGNLTASYDWSIDVYGGKTLTSRFATYDAALASINNKTYKNRSGHVGSFSGSESASSKSEWGAGTTNPGNNAKRVRRRSIRRSRESDKLKNSGPDRYFAGEAIDVPGWFKTAYYVVEISVTLTFSYGDADPLTATQTHIAVYPGSGTNLQRKFNIDWKAISGVPVAPIVPRE